MAALAFVLGLLGTVAATNKSLRGGNPSYGGYSYVASTTRFGPATGACGSIQFQEKYLDHYVVAAAQSMMSPYIDDNSATQKCEAASCTGDCDVTCKAGSCDSSQCNCQQDGNCWCGRGTAPKENTNTASMGCFSCAKARFLEAIPYNDQACSPDYTSFVGEEIKVLVIDACPYGANAKWCPKTPGDKNQCGMENHLDFAGPPAGIDNNYIVFTPVPCSDEINQQIDKDAHNGCTRQK